MPVWVVRRLRETIGVRSGKERVGTHVAFNGRPLGLHRGNRHAPSSSTGCTQLEPSTRRVLISLGNRWSCLAAVQFSARAVEGRVGHC